METRVSGDISILVPEGRLDTHTIGPVASWLDKMLANPPVRLVVNLERVTFVDSTALATFVQALKRCRQGAGTLHVCGLRHSVFMIFELTRLDKAFDIFVDEAHAIQAFES